MERKIRGAIQIRGTIQIRGAIQTFCQATAGACSLWQVLSRCCGYLQVILIRPSLLFSSAVVMHIA